jgi:hypothetical protein
VQPARELGAHGGYRVHSGNKCRSFQQHKQQVSGWFFSAIKACRLTSNTGC